MPGTPSYEAALGPQMTILAVDGRVFSTDALNEAIEHLFGGCHPPFKGLCAVHQAGLAAANSYSAAPS
jgi:hypothetical protein